MATTETEVPGQNFGFIGFGDMGAPMDGNLAANSDESQIQLSVFDIALNRDRVPASAIIAESLADIAATTDIAFMSVPDGDSSIDVVKSLLDTRESRLRCLINLSTVGIPASHQIAEMIPQDSFEYVDAPVSGGKSGAVNATITVMWSGSRTYFDDLQPLLSTFAKSVFYVGNNAGQGQALKLLNNYLSGVAMTASSEAVRFGLHHGLDLKTLLDVVHVSTGQNMAISDKFPKRILTESFDAGFRMQLMEKDISLYRQGVEAAGLPASILTEVARYWERGVEQFPDGDFTEIFKLIDVD
ncbi:MAG: NAD(P)-dependent oxidoreductase [Gammaproteobacteria bacterium]|nr:NAD(P)-dependent oxidoreductase [Gammaproteobacteria bacterium]